MRQCVAAAVASPVRRAWLLRDVLPRMTRKIRLIDLSDLLPHRWKQRRDAVAAFCAAIASLGRGH